MTSSNNLKSKKTKCFHWSKIICSSMCVINRRYYTLQMRSYTFEVSTTTRRSKIAAYEDPLKYGDSSLNCKKYLDDQKKKKKKNKREKFLKSKKNATFLFFHLDILPSILQIVVLFTWATQFYDADFAKVRFHWLLKRVFIKIYYDKREK